MKDSMPLTKIPETHFPISDFQKRIVQWYLENKAAHPWRLHWYANKNPYPIWVSEIMLQQTTLKAMIPVYEKFIRRFPTLKTLALASEEEIKQCVQGLGYYRRFSLLHKGVQQILESSTPRIQWPQSYQEWLEIPGVGDYTASALSSIALNEAVPVLDGNVIRVLCRIFDLREAPNEPKLIKNLKIISQKLVHQKSPGDYNQGIMELGQKICRPLNPQCTECPVSKSCKSFEKKSTHLAPAPKKRKELEEVRLKVYILKKNNLYGIYTRASNAKFLKNTLGFVTELEEKKSRKTASSETCLGRVKHNITHHKITAEVHVVHSKKIHPSLLKKISWLSKEDVKPQLVSSLDLKSWGLYCSSLCKN